MPSNRRGHHTVHQPRLFSGLAAEIALVTDTIPRWVRTRVDGFDPSLDTVTVRWPAAQPWWGQLSPAARALIAVACEFDAMYLAEAVVLSCVTTEPRQILLGQFASWQRLQRRDNVRQPVAVFPLSILHCRERKRFPITGTIRDVSAGGLMLCVDHEVQRGDSLAVQFTLPGDTLEIRATVEVRRVRILERRTRHVYQVGCRFRDATRQMEDHIRRFIFVEQRTLARRQRGL